MCLMIVSNVQTYVPIERVVVGTHTLKEYLNNYLSSVLNSMHRVALLCEIYFTGVEVTSLSI